MSIQRVFSYIPSSFSHWKYDVFLSFRGEDTRKNFTDHLYAALNQKGIKVFRDDNELERGKSISPELLKAIEESRFSVIVFSRNYAYSTWCLDELVKIVECNNASDQKMVFPIFYNVEPTVIRKQTGKFQEAFAKHEEAFRENIEKVQKWRDALKEVANISGWELKDRNESEFIQDIVKEISGKLAPSEFETHKELVGINSRLEELKLLLDTGSGDVRMIGIWGMGGLGKTTTARAVYDLISHEFEGSCFLADVREVCEKKGLISLQKKLLSELTKLTDSRIQNVYEGMNIIGSRLRLKKVLLVIDDVVNVKQLKGLAGRQDWFGSGSRIIITSRDEHLLITHGVDEVYKLDGLNVDEARRLFFMEAFNAHEPMKEYEHQSERALQYAAGLPLALRVLGSFLYGRTVEEWESALQRLKKDSANEILEILRISFDGLQEEEKKIFLDIACFFKGEDIEHATEILEGCDFDPVIGIHVLIEKSLISVNHNMLCMHDLLQELGHQIVKRESKEPGKRSRLWEEADVHHVFSENTGTEVMEGVIFNCAEEKMHLSARAFSKMTNLRLLKISNVQLPEGLEYLSKELRLLEWPGYPLKSLPSNFQLEKTIDLDMYHGSITQLWQGIKHLNMLKVMRLGYCQNLIKTPDFTEVSNLKELILVGCSRLQEIHPSLLLHRKLEVLNMKDCASLKSLPRKIGMNSLKKLVLSGCSKLKNFPEIGNGMECLSELFLDGTAITELPFSIELLTGLVLLNLKDCKNFKNLPSSISSLKHLKILNLSGCSKMKKFPELVGSMDGLLELFLDGTAVIELPLSIELLFGLVLLSLKDCKNLESFPSAIINGLKFLKILNLSGCLKLRKFPEIVNRMECLSELSLDGTAIEELPLSVELLSGLVSLNLKHCKNLVRLPSTINALKSLKILKLCGCSKLENMPENLGEVESLEELDISGTAIRKPESSIFLLKNLKSLSLCGDKGPPASTSTSWFSRLMSRRSSDPTALMLPSLSGLCSLIKLDLSDSNLGEGAIPNDICNLLSLKKLYLSRNNFVSLPGTINHLSELKHLKLDDCKRLESLPELPSNIEKVRVDGCASLETFSDAINSSNTKLVKIYSVNCLKLVGNNDLAFSMLKRFLETESNSGSWFNMVVPGSTIPEWFRYQNEGSSMAIIRPPDTSYNNNKLVGYAICSVFHVHKHTPAVRSRFSYRTHYLQLQIITAKNDNSLFMCNNYMDFDEHLGQPVSDHIWLHFLWNHYFDDCSYMFELSFRPRSGCGFEVKRCGVHPVYVDEREEFSYTTKEWNISRVRNFNESDQFSVFGSKIDAATTSKRSSTEYAGADASEEEPQAKRFREQE